MKRSAENRSAKKRLAADHFECWTESLLLVFVGNEKATRDGWLWRFLVSIFRVASCGELNGEVLARFDTLVMEIKVSGWAAI
jgi:hypothetical protein